MGRSDAVAVIATAEKEVENGDDYGGTPSEALPFCCPLFATELVAC